MKRIKLIFIAALMALFTVAFAGCGGEEKSEAPVPDGEYTVDVTTDSSMFHINEANEGKGLLTVEDGMMSVHISLASKRIVNLYPGPKAEAEAEGAELIEPTKDGIRYDDGIVEEVYGFDVPVPALDQEFTVSIIGTKDKWYEHTMTVSNPVEGNSVPGLAENEEGSGEDAGNSQGAEEVVADAVLEDLEDGEYKVKLTMEGGTGRATVDSPAKLVVEGGKATMTVVWSSSNYDYMIVDGEKYDPVNTEGNSTFEIPVKVLNEAFTVTADTTAMSKPHEIEYNFKCELLK